MYGGHEEKDEGERKEGGREDNDNIDRQTDRQTGWTNR